MQSDGSRIPDSQKARARVALEKYGYSEDDFEWVHSGETVYVIYRPTGFRRMYDGVDWETEFEEDLKNHIFEPGS